MGKMVKVTQVALLILLCFGLAACMSQTSTDWKVKIGEQMPAFVLKDLNGDGNVSNSSLAGKPYVISIFATWCPPCREELLALNKDVWKSLKDAGAQVIAVNYGNEDDDTIRQFIKQNGLEFPVLSDMSGELRKTLGVEMVPQTLVVGPDGSIIDLHVGVTPETIESIYRSLQAAIKE